MQLAAGRSLWSDRFTEDQRVVATPLGGDTEVDVAIVGAGLTGLWTAVALLQRDRSLRVVLLERETVGFGASSRNGGWCSALLPMSMRQIATRHGDPAAARMQAAMHQTVIDVGQFASSHDIDCAYSRGGTIRLARNQPQIERLRADIAEYHHFGFTEEDYRWLDAEEAVAMCAATQVLGAKYTPHCATVDPIRLTHGVAREVLALGGRIHEQTTATDIETGRVITDRGVVRADVVVRATEGYTSGLPGARRDLLPIYSLMIATEPLNESTWSQIHLDERPTFSDARNLVIYGQRTADGRLAFGGRGAPYHFGSKVRTEFDTDDRVRQLLTDTLRDLFPVLGDSEITHHWGGVLAAPRDWHCTVRFDRSTGFATAGGYVGDGLATTHLAGRTLAALITDSKDDEDRELVRLPWVGHRSRKWEPEPLRWIGVNAARTAAIRADQVESRRDHRSRLWGGIINAVLGH